MWGRFVGQFLGSLQLVSDKLNTYNVRKMHMINFVCIYLCMLFTLFLLGWVYQWVVFNILDLDMLLKGVNVLGSAGILALLRYVTDKVASTKIIIDRNNNGIPDDEETNITEAEALIDKEGEQNVCK
ncbi:hypothetical protein [uncultured Phascolarctobacterium sp.]|uniref:hypothetical protein n=1 Tax=Phascolarctobacterium sp. TaxID=2049039 RepID=UPI0025DDB2FB|nr:hypothetical protein [uncultured Phascolarctobacterium sp.]